MDLVDNSQMIFVAKCAHSIITVHEELMGEVPL